MELHLCTSLRFQGSAFNANVWFRLSLMQYCHKILVDKRMEDLLAGFPVSILKTLSCVRGEAAGSFASQQKKRGYFLLASVFVRPCLILLLALPWNGLVRSVNTRMILRQSCVGDATRTKAKKKSFCGPGS